MSRLGYLTKASVGRLFFIGKILITPQDASFIKSRKGLLKGIDEIKYFVFDINNTGSDPLAPYQ